MLKFKKIEHSGDSIVYQYQPNGTGDNGIVSFNTTTKTMLIVETAKEDVGNRYADKLFKHLTMYTKNSDYPNDGTVAWY